MNKIFKIEAEIRMKYTRTWPIKTGYRPGFKFNSKAQTSGSIHLFGNVEINPGEKAIVEVIFISDELLGDIRVGTEFKFYEGPIEIGDGKVLKVIGWVE